MEFLSPRETYPSLEGRQNRLAAVKKCWVISMSEETMAVLRGLPLATVGCQFAQQF